MKDKKPSTQKSTNANQKKKIGIIVVLIILLAVLLILLIQCTENSVVESEISQSADTPEATPNVLADEREGVDGTYQSMSREEILESLQNNQQIVTDTVSSNVTFSSGDAGTIGEWLLENVEENTVIQQAEIYYDEDNLMIAQTEPVYPGQYIQAVELLEDLGSGEYEAIAYINYYNEDDKTYVGQAGYKIHLTIN